MRWFFPGLLVVAAATSASAQSTQFDLDNLRYQQEAAARRAVALSNELGALEGRLRTEQAIADLRLQREFPRLTDLSPTTSASAAAAALGGVAIPAFPSTPDSVLADSNRRVREASRPRR